MRTAPGRLSSFRRARVPPWVAGTPVAISNVSEQGLRSKKRLARLRWLAICDRTIRSPAPLLSDYPRHSRLRRIESVERLDQRGQRPSVDGRSVRNRGQVEVDLGASYPDSNRAEPETSRTGTRRRCLPCATRRIGAFRSGDSGWSGQ